MKNEKERASADAGAFFNARIRGENRGILILMAGILIFDELPVFFCQVMLGNGRKKGYNSMLYDFFENTSGRVIYVTNWI